MLKQRIEEIKSKAVDNLHDAGKMLSTGSSLLKGHCRGSFDVFWS